MKPLTADPRGVCTRGLQPPQAHHQARHVWDWQAVVAPLLQWRNLQHCQGSLSGGAQEGRSQGANVYQPEAGTRRREARRGADSCMLCLMKKCTIMHRPELATINQRHPLPSQASQAFGQCRHLTLTFAPLWLDGQQCSNCHILEYEYWVAVLETISNEKKEYQMTRILNRCFAKKGISQILKHWESSFLVAF